MNQSVNFPDSLAQVTRVTNKKSALQILQTRLGILLAIQMVLVLGIFAWQQNRNAVPEPQALLTASTNEADKIIIRGDNTSVSLQKVKGQWQLPEYHQLAADEKKLISLLDKLKNTKLTWPVATSSNSHERFDVSEKKYQRHISLFKGDQQIASIFLGNSAGFKKLHIRKQDDDSVYSVQLSSYEFATQQAEWLKKDLLAVRDAQQIIGPDFVLQKNNDLWLFGNSSEKLDTNKASDLAAAFAALQVIDVTPEFPSGEKQAFTLNPGAYTYEFATQDNRYFVKRGDLDKVFTISQFDYDRIVKITQADLIDKTATVNPVDNLIEDATRGLVKPALDNQ